MLTEYLEGRRRFKGRLVCVADDSIEVEVDGEVFELPFAVIDKARLVGGEQP